MRGARALCPRSRVRPDAQSGSMAGVSGFEVTVLSTAFAFMVGLICGAGIATTRATSVARKRSIQRTARLFDERRLLMRERRDTEGQAGEQA